MGKGKTGRLGPDGTLFKGACFSDPTWKRAREWLGGGDSLLPERGVTLLAPALSTSQPPQEPRSQMLRAKAGEFFFSWRQLWLQLDYVLRKYYLYRKSTLSCVNNFWNKVRV